MQYYCINLIFSKDRALQLDATLRSFQLHCRDSHSAQIRVLYTTSAPFHAEQYETLIREFARYQNIQFVLEQDFRTDVLALLAPFDHVLFLVDDSIFVRDFRLAEVIEKIQQNADAIGFSLRLGRNTSYCYTLDKKQHVPELQVLGNSVLKFSWTDAEYDFGYPLELSSSVYRTEDMIPFLARLQFKNPNTLEGAMSVQRNTFQKDKPFLLCFEHSAAFSVPLNMVQTMWQNRASQNMEFSPDRLAERFAQGHRIDIHHYTNFTPNACHQEVELKYIAPITPSHEKPLPLISVIIPCYKQAQYLPEAVESVVNQTYKNWECIIVNDGSPDNTSEAAHRLIEKYPLCRIRLLEKPNTGLADARNTGIRKARGTWILPLDSDDKFAPEYMERAVRIIESGPSINIVTTNEQAFGALPHEWIPNEYDRQRILTENTFIYASLYKKKLWESVGGYYPGIPWGAEDWNFWIACSKAGITHKRIHEKLFLYRTHAGTSMRDTMKKHWPEVVAIIHTLHPELYPSQRIISDHKTIAGAHPDTVAKIDSVISRFPDLAMPYFWRGLIYERSGNLDLAQLNYEKSLALSGGNNWQQELHLIQIKALTSDSSRKSSLSLPEHLLPQLSQGPVHSREQEAKKKSVDLVENIGQVFCRIAVEDQELFQKNIREKIAESHDKNNSKPPFQTPPPVTAKDAADNFRPYGMDHGITIIAPDNYTNKSWYEEAKRLFVDDAEIVILSPPSGEGFEKIRFRKNILFLGASHHLPGLFNNDSKIRFWNSIPSKKYFYQYEKVIGSFLPDSEQKERNVHKIASEAYAVQDEYDVMEYEKTFGKIAVWLPDMISVEKIRRGQEYPPLSQRPIDLLFVGKIQGSCYQRRQEILNRLYSYGASRKLKTVIVDTSYIRFNDVDIIEKNYYSQAKVVINPIGTGNFFNIRFFETLAAGCICLQQIDNNGVLLHAFQERYKEYNAVYFTSSDPEQKISSIFSDIGRFEKNVSNTHALLLERDTGEARFQALGISCERSDYRPAPPPISAEQVSVLRDRTVTVGSSIKADEKPGIKVSVIIPCYKQAQYLPNAVESVVNQTYKNWECLIVNDGSPDNTSEVARKLIAQYPGKRILLLEKDNGGLPDARNYGIKHSAGKYILPLDADDGIHSEMLHKAVSFLESNPEITVAFTHVVHIKGTEVQKVIAFSDIDPTNLLIINCFTYCSLFRRELWDATGGYNPNMAGGYEDWDFWVSCLEKGFLRPKCIPEPLFFYRVKEFSMIKQAVKNDAELKARLILNHPSLFNTAQRAWAKGVRAGDPDILSIFHKEGTIPGFFEPLPDGLSAQENFWQNSSNAQSPHNKKEQPDVFPAPEPVTKADPAQQIMTFINQADTFLAINDFESAREAIKQAIPLAASNNQLSIMLTTILDNLRDQKTAEQFLRSQQNRQ